MEKSTVARSERDEAFSGTRVVITGATSGIGAACARWFGARGARLLLTGRDRDRGEEQVQAIKAAGGSAEFMAGDVRDDAFCLSLIDTAENRWGGVDVLVNSAGVLYRADAIQTSNTQWNATLATNVSAMFYLCRAVLPLMRIQGSGVIVNIASELGLVGARDSVAYCASKGAVVLMTKAMALDHAAEGIRINAVCPGDTAAPSQPTGINQMGVPAADSPSDVAVPMGRLGTVDEVAATVGFLASEQAAFMTGVALPVDGGQTAG